MLPIQSHQRHECFVHNSTSSLRFQPSMPNPATLHPAYIQTCSRLCSLQRGFHWGRRELSSKDDVPESAGDSETVLIIHEVVLEVILLEFSPIGG